MERVLGTARDEERLDAYTKVVDLGVRPWLGGTLPSAVQMTIGRLDAGEPKRQREPGS